MSTVLEARFTVFDQVWIKSFQNEKFPNRVVQKTNTFIPLNKFLRNRAILTILWKIMLNKTDHSSVCVLDNLGDSRNHIM